MKCIQCGTDTKYKDRPDGKCPHCSHHFAFEPTKGDKLTDPAFLAAIQHVSSNGTVKWTPHHLYYEVARRTRRVNRALPWLVLALAAVLTPVGLFGLACLSLPALLVVIALRILLRTRIHLAREDFEKLWQRWVAINPHPDGLIVRKAPARTSAAPRAVAPDIQHYSFDRAVVTDRIETADVLLANNFHFENNCAVFTAGGYPAEAFETVRGMLRNNPKLCVYVLHDATPEGCLLAQTLRSRGWFQSTATIVDVGLRPGHAAPFKGLWQPALAPEHGLSRLPRAEAAWLAKHSLELAVIRPEQIIKRLFRAMSGLVEHEPGSSVVAPSTWGPDRDGGTSTGGSDGVYNDSSSFGSDASASDGGGDSFG